MERKMWRTDKVMPESAAKEILKNGEYGILSTVSGDGQPYGVPLHYSYSEGLVYFHCAREGHKLDNLHDNNMASFCVVGKTEVLPQRFGTRYESVIVSGRVFEITDAEKQRGLTELLNKYCSGFLKEGRQYMDKDGGKTRVYKIVIGSISGKSGK